MKVKVRWEKDQMSLVFKMEGEPSLKTAWDVLSMGEDTISVFRGEGYTTMAVTLEEWLQGTVVVVEEPILHTRLVPNHPVRLVRFNISLWRFSQEPAISNGRACPEGKNLKDYQDGDVLVVFPDYHDQDEDGYRRSDTTWSLYVTRLCDWLKEGHPPPGGFSLFVNLTPHEVRVGGVKFPPSGKVCRVVDEIIEISSNLQGFDTARCLPLEVENLPWENEAPGSVYIVSRLVLDTLKMWGYSRSDVVAPDTGPKSVTRDADGRITGTRRFLVI